MARWRKIDVRIWNDRKFRQLSEDGRMLWLYLVTCPETTSIPGIVMTGQGAICDGLEWSRERFRIPFGELVSKGMAEADFEARLVWLPKAIKYNPPANGNVVKGWADQWDEVPECDLKLKAWRVLKQYTERFQEQFAKACPQPSPEPCANGMPTQEQEQEQEQESPQSPPAGGSSGGAIPDGEPRPDSKAAKARAFAFAGVTELASLTGNRLDPRGKQALRDAQRLVGDGYSPDDAKAVARAKFRQWHGDSEMREYLKPGTVFRPGNFRRYAENDVTPADRGEAPPTSSAHAILGPGWRDA